MALIGLISDVHASPRPVEEALEIFDRENVDLVYCAGDIAGYFEQCEEVVELLVRNQVVSIIGNHDLQYIDHQDDDDLSKTYFAKLPAFIREVIDGVSIYMVHAQPPDGCHGGIKLLDKEGEVLAEQISTWTDKLKQFDSDVLIVGHSHQVYSEQLGETLVINPGSTVFNHSCAIFSTSDRKVSFHALSEQHIKKSWNWSDFISSH